MASLNEVIHETSSFVGVSYLSGANVRAHVFTRLLTLSAVQCTVDASKDLLGWFIWLLIKWKQHDTASSETTGSHYHTIHSRVKSVRSSSEINEGIDVSNLGRPVPQIKLHNIPCRKAITQPTQRHLKVIWKLSGDVIGICQRWITMKIKLRQSFPTRWYESGHYNENLS